MIFYLNLKQIMHLFFSDNRKEITLSKKEAILIHLEKNIVLLEKVNKVLKSLNAEIKLASSKILNANNASYRLIHLNYSQVNNLSEDLYILGDNYQFDNYLTNEEGTKRELVLIIDHLGGGHFLTHLTEKVPYNSVSEKTMKLVFSDTPSG